MAGTQSKPVRIKLSRQKGSNLQRLSRTTNGLEAVRVARPSIFGNPFVIGEHGDRAKCVAHFRDALQAAESNRTEALLWAARILDNLDRIRGRNLACYCSLEGPCHADVLLELAGQ